MGAGNLTMSGQQVCNLAIPNLRICLVCDRLLCVLCLPERLLVGFQISAGDLSPAYAGRITESDQNLCLFLVKSIDSTSRRLPGTTELDPGHVQLQTRTCNYRLTIQSERRLSPLCATIVERRFQRGVLRRHPRFCREQTRAVRW